MIFAEALGRQVAATPTGSCFEADLADPRWVLVAVADQFQNRYVVEGDPPKIDASVPPGAIP